MLIAGETSGDLLASELVEALRAQTPDAKFFGAGGAKMSKAGVDLAFDLTQHAVVGFTDVLKKLLEFRRMLHQLVALAVERQPDVVIGVDFGGFNLRLGHAIKQHLRDNPFSQWNPKIVQFVSPQVWASRPGRAQLLAEDYDLLLSIFPFEKDWYARHTPSLRVKFVGHPMMGRFHNSELRIQRPESPTFAPQILLLPGSRRSELKRHLEPMLEALRFIQAKRPKVRSTMVLPSLALKAFVDRQPALPVNLKIQIGELPWALAGADVAIASTGTVTMECALFGVPTVTLYKTSWLTYEIARRMITVKSLTMPNIMASEEVYPEFIQKNATPENMAAAALDLLENEPRRAKIKAQLKHIIASLGGPGAPQRAAEAILSLF